MTKEVYNKAMEILNKIDLKVDQAIKQLQDIK